MSSRLPLLLATALLATVTACKKPVDENAVLPAGNSATLLGTWTTDGPVDFSGEGLRTSVSDGRTVYKPDRTFDYTGRLTIFGNSLPTQGLSFSVSGTGQWKHEGNQLTEDYTAVTVRSENNDAELNRLATQLGNEMRDQPPTESTVVELTAEQLELRDRTSDRTTTFTRQPAG